VQNRGNIGHRGKKIPVVGGDATPRPSVHYNYGLAVGVAGQLIEELVNVAHLQPEARLAGGSRSVDFCFISGVPAGLVRLDGRVELASVGGVHAGAVLDKRTRQVFWVSKKYYYY
jgi:hypothetical protein